MGDSCPWWFSFRFLPGSPAINGKVGAWRWQIRHQFVTLSRQMQRSIINDLQAELVRLAASADGAVPQNVAGMPVLMSLTQSGTVGGGLDRARNVVGMLDTAARRLVSLRLSERDEETVNYTASATALLGLADGRGLPPPRRRRLAARYAEKSVNAFTRARGRAPSQEQRLLTALATALVEQELKYVRGQQDGDPDPGRQLMSMQSFFTGLWHSLSVTAESFLTTQQVNQFGHQTKRRTGERIDRIVLGAVRDRGFVHAIACLQLLDTSALGNEFAALTTLGLRQRWALLEPSDLVPDHHRQPGVCLDQLIAVLPVRRATLQELDQLIPRPRPLPPDEKRDQAVAAIIRERDSQAMARWHELHDACTCLVTEPPDPDCPSAAFHETHGDYQGHVYNLAHRLADALSSPTGHTAWYVSSNLEQLWPAFGLKPPTSRY